MAIYKIHEVIDNKTARGTGKPSVIVLPASGEWPVEGIDIEVLQSVVEGEGYSVVDFSPTRGDIFGLADMPCPIFELG